MSFSASYIDEEIDLLITSDTNQGARNKNSLGSEFTVFWGDGGIGIPNDAENINVSVVESNVWWTIPNIITGVNDKIYVYGDNDQAEPTSQLFTITLPQGLYDLNGLNVAIQSGLEAVGAKTMSNNNLLPLISLSPDSNTQKVRLRLNYANVYVDFTQPNTFREIIGFNSQIYGPNPTAPVNILAPNVAAFNQINYLLIHSDIVDKGIRFNNTYNQTIAQVLINVAPGSQIVSTPFHPAKCNGEKLKGSTNSARFWLTDDSQRLVNTNGEDWNFRLVITYQRPKIIMAPAR